MKNFLISFFIFFIVSTISFSQGSWKTITAINPPGSVYGIDISFVNDSLGYMASNNNNRIYKTTDHGETWNSIAILNSNMRSLEFVNDTIGFMGRLPSTTGSPGDMYRTLDGGITWSQLTNLQMAGDDGICGIEKYGNTVIAIGTYSGPPWFYRSDDFGNNWSKLDLSTFSSGLVDCFMYSSDTIIICGASDSVSGYRANILKSTDGGNSWQQVFIASKPSTSCWKIFMRPSGKGIASIQNYITDTLKAAITNDFGNTWQEVTVAPPKPVILAGVCFLNDTLGWISPEYFGISYETLDGGITWDSITTVRGVNRFVLVDSATVLGPGVVGLTGVIYKYDSTLVGIPENYSTDINEDYYLKVIPNPVTNTMTIEATAAANTLGILRIVDLKGAVMMNLTKQFFKQGTTTLNHKIELPAGNYFLVWLTNNMNVTQPFAVTR